ncbi:MFS transporter [Mycobacterium simulans]|uniref:MFS transporter n=1 Tax=Mycobacterium simulans TaxID=627089 RepID=UPI001CD4CA4C|nr:MFS transporter [Mycobacterium simulans]
MPTWLRGDKTSATTSAGDLALVTVAEDPAGMHKTSSLRSTWRPATLLACVFASIMAGSSLPTPMYALYAQRMHFGALTTTIVFAAFIPGVLFGLLAFGRWSDAVGRRPMLLAGLAGALASALVFLTAGTVLQLLAGRALSGLSVGVAIGAATAAVIEAVPPSRRAHATALATIANSGGVGLGSALTGLLVQYAPHPLQSPLIVHVVLVVVAGAGVLGADETSTRTAGVGVQRLSVPKPARRAFVTAATTAFAGSAVMGTFGVIGPWFVSNIHGVSNHAVAGAVAGAPYVASAVTQVVGRHLNPRRAVALGSAGLVIGTVIVAVSLWTTSVAALIVGGVVEGAGQGVTFSRGMAALVDRTPTDRRAEISSTYFTVAYIGIALPVIGQGLAAQACGLRTAGVTFALAAAALAAVCVASVLIQDARH